MNNSPEITTNKNTPSTACNMISKLSNCYVKGDYDMSLSLFDDKKATTPSCTHRINGHMKHSLLYLIGLGGLMAGAFALAVCIGHTCSTLMCCRK